MLRQLYQSLTPLQLEAVLLEMAKRPAVNMRGFPDLFLWRADSYLLAEVKSPTDHLSAQQVFWLDFFRSHHITAGIIRVQWQ
jgi:hypothetical protein